MLARVTGLALAASALVAAWRDGARRREPLGSVAAVAASLYLLRRDAELAVYSIAALGMSIVGAPAPSMPRHALVAFPAFAAVGDRLGPRWTAVLTVAFAVMQIWFASAAFGLHPKAP